MTQQIVDVFWATPAVFWPDSESWIAAQKAMLTQQALEQGVKLNLLSPIDTALEQECCVDESIFLSNVAMITQAHAVIADVSPFRSLEPDVGTVLEIGLATQLGKPVYLYSNSANLSLQDAYRSQMNAQGHVEFSGKPTQVEHFGHPVNLMLMFDLQGKKRKVYENLQDALRQILSDF